MLRTLTLAIVLLSATRPLPGAQARPDLTGTWIMDLDRSESAKQTEPIGPTTVAIVQSTQDMVFTVTRGDKSATVTYRFDGRPTAIPGGSATSTQTISGAVLARPATDCSLLPSPAVAHDHDWFPLTVTLVVHDNAGNVSALASNPNARVFPAGTCGF